MSKKDKVTKIWVNAEDLSSNPEFLASQQQEFISLPVVNTEESIEESENPGPNRRDFLKYMGFGIGAAAISSCEIPVKKAIPYVVKPEEIVPGVANYYASTFTRGGDCVPVLVKTREGRPIKIEGNPLAALTKRGEGFHATGGTSARVQATVLELYDTNRLEGPKRNEGEGTQVTWDVLDMAVRKGLNANSKVLVLSHTTLSPTLIKAIGDFKATYPGTEHVQYDPFSCSALLEANQQTHNKSLVPDYRFDKAKCVVSFAADFLGTWISPIEYTRDYSKNRGLRDEDIAEAGKKMSIHIQLESNMSLTGSNADHRIMVKPSEQGAALIQLYNAVASALGKNTISGPSATYTWTKASKAIDSTAKKLLEAAKRREALVICGVNDVNMQLVVNALNEMLGAYGSTILWDNYSNQRKGIDGNLKTAIDNLPNYDAIFILDANPAFDIPNMAGAFSKALKTATDAKKLTVSLASSVDDTASLCQYIAPDHHYLESWGDANPKRNYFYLVQPTIHPLFNTRQAGLSFLTWANRAPETESPYLTYLQEHWKLRLFPHQASFITFGSFWNTALHDGVFELEANHADATSSEEVKPEEVVPEEESNQDKPPVSNIYILAATAASSLPQPTGAETMEVVLYETINMGAGQYANNPWLLEMPDPVMRTTWDNFISIPIQWNSEVGNEFNSLNNLKDGDKAKLTIAGKEYELPVIRQFGQLDNTIAIGLGYGRGVVGKAGTNVGKNLFPVVSFKNNFNYYSSGVSLSEKIGKDDIFATVQIHHTYGIQNEYEGKTINVDELVLGHRGFQGSLTNRSVIFQGTAAGLKEDVKSLKKKRKAYQKLNAKGLYPDRKEVYGMGHHWGMAVDLASCTGCGACTVACMAENNVPVVGKFEVSKAHEMTWLRIDRYFYGDEETPNTVYQPMMCQHCDNAPCENVCPVAATNHSSEGLNQMTYNRCIGTRYCANNCPFKVRRFNWLDYTTADVFPSNEPNLNRGREGTDSHLYINDNLTRMVLNPDVTVRSRGVIEKCSFCVQRIQEQKLASKVEGRGLDDGRLQTACQQACPSGALVFGDQNDPNSEVSKRMKSQRAYIPLEETNVRSSVSYLMKVTNKDETFTA